MGVGDLLDAAFVLHPRHGLAVHELHEHVLGAVGVDVVGHHVDASSRTVEDLGEAHLPAVEDALAEGTDPALTIPGVARAEVGEVRAHDKAVAAGGVDGVRTRDEHLVEVVLHAAPEEVAEVGLVPDAPVLDPVAVAIHGGGHEGGVVLGGGHAVAAPALLVGVVVVATGLAGPARGVGHRDVDVEPLVAGRVDEAIGHGPVVAAVGRLELVPVHVEAGPAHPRGGAFREAGLRGLVGVDAEGASRVGGREGEGTEQDQEHGDLRISE